MWGRREQQGDVQMCRWVIIFQSHMTPSQIVTSSWGGVSPGRFSQKVCLSKFGEHRPFRHKDTFNFTLLNFSVQHYSTHLPLKIADFLRLSKKRSAYTCFL